MITDRFINLCFSLVLKREQDKRISNISENILDIIKFYESKEYLDIPILMKNKIDCLKSICELKINGKNNDIIIDNILSGKKYISLVDFLNEKTNEKITEDDTNNIIKQIGIRKKFTYLLSNYDKMIKITDTLKDGSFDTMENIVEQYESLLKSQYFDIMEQKRLNDIQSIVSLDFSSDDWTPATNEILEKYSGKNSIPTGFDILDNYIFRGGLEPSRLYILAGGSGSGKSSLMLNFLQNAAINNRIECKNNNKKIFLYITLENTIEESLLRYYMSKNNKNLTESLKDISEGVNIKNSLLEDLEKNNSNIIMKYFPANSIGVLDIEVVINNILDIYGPDSLKAVYIDYLDILKSEKQTENFRFELSYITIGLKCLAVAYNVPIITGSQLTKNVYTIKSGSELNLSYMSESIKKVEHADCVILMIYDENQNVVHVKIGKNRNGKSGYSLDFQVNFDTFKFINGYKMTSETTMSNIKDNICRMDTVSAMNGTDLNSFSF